MHLMIKGLSMNLYHSKITDTWFHLRVHIIQQAYCTNKMIFIDWYGHLCNVHSYDKCKDLDHLFIICGSEYASCISRNPFKALSIHVNHTECLFLRTSSFRVSCYQIVLSAQDIVLHGAAQSPTRVVCPYTLSNLCQHLKTKNLVKIRLLKGNLI
jgi:hypothetical protein